MGVSGISGTGITGTLSTGKDSLQRAKLEKENSFISLLQDASKSAEKRECISGVASSQIASNHRLNGDYTQGFYNYYTSEGDKNAKPEGMAAAVSGENGSKPVIDKTSELYAQSKELENYMVKMMISSMRDTIHHTSLTGEEENNNFARDMYEDMMYDNYAESLTKNSHFGLADQIYLELSGQK